MILIDDSGSGSLIGGTIIGAMRAETNEFYYNIIPLKYYSPELFQKKIYLDQATQIAVELFNRLKVSKDEEILVCRGYMFDKVRRWLKDNSYKLNIHSTFIEFYVGFMQIMIIEYTFVKLDGKVGKNTVLYLSDFHTIK